VLHVLQWLGLAVTFAMAAGTLINLHPSPHWFVRGWDFPRLQIAILCLVGAVPHFAFFATWGWFDYLILAVVTATEVTSHVGLLAAVPDDVRRAFADRALAPVLAHDARAGTGLLPTLEAFLDCDGSWSRTAARLHLHVNSVRYRIARVEELTGRDLGTLRDRVDLLLQLPLGP